MNFTNYLRRDKIRGAPSLLIKKRGNLLRIINDNNLLDFPRRYLFPAILFFSPRLSPNVFALRLKIMEKKNFLNQ